MKTVDIAELKRNLENIVDEIDKTREPVILVEKGKFLLRFEPYDVSSWTWVSQLEHNHALIESEAEGEALSDPAKLVRKMREERDAELLCPDTSFLEP